MSMTMWTRRLAVLGAGLLLAAPAGAQENDRSLHWAELRVEARLDGDGTLHVRERHGMVFHGDWNGGERELEPRLGQRLRVEGVWRVLPGSGELRPLVDDDDLDEIDQYEADDGRIRWRSRLPDDPPFEGDRIDYVIDYVVSNAILPRDGGYILDRDFMVVDRASTVERFSLALTLDDAWATDPGFTGSWEAVNIPPGRGFAVRVPLAYEGEGSPATVLQPPSIALRSLLTASLVAGSLMLLLAFYRRERAAGRYAPLPHVVDEAWLREHVLSLPPEVVGAAWDRHTGAAEVAGLLARLVQEEKLASRVEADEGPGSKDPVLHLELLVPRDDFDGYERALIDALFFDDRQETDTKTVKERYRESGFDPAGKISPVLGDRVDGLAGGGTAARDWRAATTGLALGTSLLIAAVIVRPEDVLPAVLGFIFLIVLGTLATAVASVYARRVIGLRGLFVGFALPLVLMAAGLSTFVAGALEASTPWGGPVLSPYYHPGPLLLLALVVLALAMVATTLTVARSTETPERLGLRRRLAAAEAYFRQQLERPQPALHDEWFPYLLAFGLGSHIDEWFAAYGAQSGSTAATTAVLASAAGSNPPSSGATGSGGSTWTGGGAAFGGGGGFSGGGVAGSWGAAAGTIATGVSSPGSGGTAAGVASSGGGGGGGW